jgi:ubiquinone/menaquinone biosynthesis C-methylase UbiE
VRRRLRPLLPGLHVLPTLSERPGDTVVSIRGSDAVSELAARVAPEGDLFVVDESVEELEQLRRTTTAPNVAYLIGSIEVLPLTDSSVDEILAKGAICADAAGECFRVLRPGGQVAIAAPTEDPTGHALNLDPHEVERLFIDTGFASVSVASEPGRLVILARKP